MNYKIIFILFLLIQISCSVQISMSEDVNDTNIPLDTITTMTDSLALLGYKVYEVDFITTYPYCFRITPATFETTVNQVLIKDAGTSESIYELDTIKIPKKDSYNTFRSYINIDSIKILNNKHDSSTILLPCIGDNYESWYEFEEGLPFYFTYEYERLIEYRPNGDTILATYSDMSYQKLVSNANFERIENHIGTTGTIFIVEDNISIENYINQIYEDLGYPTCLDPSNYRIKE